MATGREVAGRGAEGQTIEMQVERLLRAHERFRRKCMREGSNHQTRPTYSIDNIAATARSSTARLGLSVHHCAHCRPRRERCRRRAHRLSTCAPSLPVSRWASARRLGGRPPDRSHEARRTPRTGSRSLHCAACRQSTKAARCHSEKGQIFAVAECLWQRLQTLSRVEF